MRSTLVFFQSITLVAATWVGAGHAQAGDAARGRLAYDNACARCHSADVATGSAGALSAKKSAGGPDLVRSLKARQGPFVRGWISAPGAGKESTCDPRALKAHEVEDLLSFLYSHAQPLPAPKLERKKAQLAQRLGEREAQAGPTQKSLSQSRRTP